MPFCRALPERSTFKLCLSAFTGRLNTVTSRAYSLQVGITVIVARTNVIHLACTGLACILVPQLARVLVTFQDSWYNLSTPVRRETRCTVRRAPRHHASFV